jgi:hypothetical protein
VYEEEAEDKELASDNNLKYVNVLSPRLIANPKTQQSTNRELKKINKSRNLEINKSGNPIIQKSRNQ